MIENIINTIYKYAKYWVRILLCIAAFPLLVLVGVFYKEPWTLAWENAVEFLVENIEEIE